MATSQDVVAAKPWLETYQPLIGLVLGVVLAFATNTLLLWIKQGVEDKRAARMVRLALVAELEIYQSTRRSTEVDLANGVETEDETFIVPIITSYPMYEQHKSSIGLLSEGEVKAIVEAYTYMFSTAEFLLPIARFRRDEHLLTALVPCTRLVQLRDMNSKILSRLEAATKALRAKL